MSDKFSAMFLALLVTGMVFLCEHLSEKEEAPSKEVMISIGESPECVIETPLSTWDEMNGIGLYKWVAACEENPAAFKGTKP